VSLTARRLLEAIDDVEFETNRSTKLGPRAKFREPLLAATPRVRDRDAIPRPANL
jgi:hypothetical protein